MTLLLLMVYGLPWAADISVKTDRDPVVLNEKFRIIFTVKGSLNDEPDFSPLNKDFKLLGTGQSSRVSVVNSSVSSSKTYTLTVMAANQGNIKIPPIHFGHDKSPEISITVVAANNAPQAHVAPSANRDLMFITSEVDNQSPYVQQQVLLTIKVYQKKQWADASLSDPHFDGVETRFQSLGEASTYEAPVGNEVYRVFKLVYALFPQQSGELKIAPFRVTAKFPAGARKRNLFGNSFFDDFFLRQTYENKTAQSNSVSLKVRPIPASFIGKHWLPAKRIQLQETWSADIRQAKAGEPVTRTLALIGDGVGTDQLPDITMAESAQVKHYPDQPVVNEQVTDKGLLSTYTQKFVTIPSKSGSYSIPAIEIPWWDTTNDKMRVARLAATEFVVTGDTRLTPVMNTVPVTLAEPVDEVPEGEGRAESLMAFVGDSNMVLSAAVILLAILWLMTLLIFLRRKRTLPAVKPRTGAAGQNISRKAALQQLHTACDSQQAAAVRDALIQWAKVVWPQHPPSNLDSIAMRLPVIAARQINRLSVSLYGQHRSDWDAKAIWQVIQNLPPETDSHKKAGDDDKLEPLYR